MNATNGYLAVLNHWPDSTLVPALDILGIMLHELNEIFKSLILPDKARIYLATETKYMCDILLCNHDTQIMPLQQELSASLPWHKARSGNCFVITDARNIRPRQRVLDASGVMISLSFNQYKAKEEQGWSLFSFSCDEINTYNTIPMFTGKYMSTIGLHAYEAAAYRAKTEMLCMTL